MGLSKKQICHAALVDRILTLDIAPGSMLDEILLCKEYELSRTPLREVLQKLGGEGYVQLEENRGAKVSSMDLENMRQFFQSAPMIYSAVTRLAAENASVPEVEALKSVQLKFKSAAESADARAMVIENHRFHSLIGEMARNPYLSPSLNRLLIDHTRMSQKFYRPIDDHGLEMVRTASDQHDQMIEAIEKREPVSAVELTLDHWELSRNQVERFVMPDPLPMQLGDLESGRIFEDRKHAV